MSLSRVEARKPRFSAGKACVVASSCASHGGATHVSDPHTGTARMTRAEAQVWAPRAPASLAFARFFLAVEVGEGKRFNLDAQASWKEG